MEPADDEEIVQVKTIPMNTGRRSKFAEVLYASASSSSECKETHSCRSFSNKLKSLTLSSRQCTQRAVQRLMVPIRKLCEESALGAEDSASINMDTLVSSIWPQAEFEGIDKDHFCNLRYNLLANVEEQAMNGLCPEERQTLIIILSVKDGVCEALRLMGFSELQETHLHHQTSANPTYEWRIRRFCDSGLQHATQLIVNWSMVEFESPRSLVASNPVVVDYDRHWREVSRMDKGSDPRNTQARRPCDGLSHLYSSSSRSGGSGSPRSHISFRV